MSAMNFLWEIIFPNAQSRGLSSTLPSEVKHVTQVWPVKALNSLSGNVTPGLLVGALKFPSGHVTQAWPIRSLSGLSGHVTQA